ncbi:L,D-transpeptidase family protein [Flavisphingomonas formosensis]|uniref:L,D-transpeptidase family protein n=1 Tax=Flavisphingomonas formosensis TaxID=861534 RepID=UPI0012F8BD4C|nr:L,D-transpeptidase family protein [Sphingomonas formosensis]
MRGALLGGSLLLLALPLSGCDFGNPRPDKPSVEVKLEEPHWTAQTADQLRRTIAGRAIHGLDRLAFDTSAAAGTTAGDAALTRVALAYANALARGAADPARLFAEYTLPRPAIDARAGLIQALDAGRLDVWLDGLAPQSDDYRKLSAAYLAAAPGSAVPVTGKPIGPGDSDARVPAISGSAKARAIAVEMERLRWLDRIVPATRIDVNIATAELEYWRDGMLADNRRVITGDSDTQTPQLGSPLFQLVANPTWTVPRSIQRRELAGKGDDYLRRHNMQWKNGRIVQLSGPQNSLGLVKFGLKNPYAIYLHDTPAKHLFHESERQRSHGCVRVEDALGFADMIARDEGVSEQWQAARSGDKQRFVSLPREIPVRLLYRTVVFDNAGAPVVRADPYGWNDRIAAKLGFAVPASREARSQRTDIGP